MLYSGSDDGTVQVTRDGGAHWSNITAKVSGLPANTYVSSVLASRHVAGRVYATFDGHYNDDYRPVRLRERRLRADVARRFQPACLRRVSTGSGST